MKYIISLIAGLMLIPSVSSAAALTGDQANSLISVVQSSTSTPASAFVPLITAFSSITVPQAESLINVVQLSPSTPASAFVPMLIAFTVDPIPTPVLGSTATTTPVETQPVIPTPISSSTTTQPAPVVQSVPMDKSDIVINEVRQRPADAKANQPFGSVQIFVSVLNPAGSETEAEVTMNAPDNIYGVLTGKAQRADPHKNEWRFGAMYVPTSGGTKTVTFTSGNLTKTYDITF